MHFRSHFSDIFLIITEQFPTVSTISTFQHSVNMSLHTESVMTSLTSLFPISSDLRNKSQPPRLYSVSLEYTSLKNTIIMMNGRFYYLPNSMYSSKFGSASITQACNWFNRHSRSPWWHSQLKIYFLLGRIFLHHEDEIRHSRMNISSDYWKYSNPKFEQRYENFINLQSNHIST